MSQPDSLHVTHLTDMHVFHRNRLFVDCLMSVLGNLPNYRVSLVDANAVLTGGTVPASSRQIALVDARLPDKLATRLLERFKITHPHIKALVIVPQDDSDAVIDCVTAGATGCVLEESTLDELLMAIDRIAAGETFCSPQLVSSMFQQLAQLTRPSITTEIAVDAPLTRREHEVLTLLAEGLTNQDIATQLSLSLYTVKNHVHNILEKLDVENRFHAIEHARRRRLLPRTRMPSKLP